MKLMVRRSRYMGSHRADRVTIGSTVLNPQAFNRICIITDPSLRCVIQHTCIKTRSAAGARFEQNVRKACGQPLIHLINTQNVAVKYFSLLSGGNSSAPYITETSVHIPLDIGNGGAFQNRCNLFIDVIKDLLPGKIQYILVTSVTRRSPWNLEDPIRMRAE